jgi:hypothetical protein
MSRIAFKEAPNSNSLAPTRMRLQPEGSSNFLILWLQPEGGYNPLGSLDTIGRWIQPPSSQAPT